MDEKLQQLADRLGIATAYTDVGLKTGSHQVSEDTVRFFAGVLGFKAADAGEVTRSLRALDTRRWQNVLEPVYVVLQKHKVFDAEGDFSLTLTSRQTGVKSDVSFVVLTLPESRVVAGKKYQKLEIEITSDVEIGYYDAELTTAGGTFVTLLAVAPDKCYRLPGLDEKKRSVVFFAQPP